MSRHVRVLGLAATTAVLSGLLAGVTPAAHAATSPLDDAFYRYTGTTALAKVRPGTVLKTREVPYSIAGSSLSLKAVQVLYRTQDQYRQPVANVTTVVRSAGTVVKNPKVLSYQAAYDSLNPADEPSVSIVSGKVLGAPVAGVESSVFAPLLAAGYVVNIPDFEGQKAQFADGRSGGTRILDSLQAISTTSTTGVGSASKIGLLGYSGGGTASEWAAALATDQAIKLNKRIVGTAVGGVIAHPGHVMHYVEGSQKWAGYLPLALVSLSRSLGLDVSRSLSTTGQTTFTQLASSSLSSVVGAYPGLTWAQLAKPVNAVPEHVRAYLTLVNHNIMARSDFPKSPMYIGQGTGGVADGSPVKAAYGPGDGLTIAGDTRSVARVYCTKKVAVKYEEYAGSHYGAVAQWLPAAYAYLQGRFAGTTAPTSCGSIAVGNSLAPVTYAK